MFVKSRGKAEGTRRIDVRYLKVKWMKSTIGCTRYEGFHQNLGSGVNDERVVKNTPEFKWHGQKVIHLIKLWRKYDK
jgi:hypothetical protein